MKRVIVLVRCLVGEPTDEEDENVEGDYEIDLDDDVPLTSMADAALDVFHSGVPIGILEEFDFKVVQPLEPDLGHEGYSMSHRGRMAS